MRKTAAAFVIDRNNIVAELTRGYRVFRRCERCQSEFYPKAFDVDHGNGRFCSHSCASKTIAETNAKPPTERFWAMVDKNGPNGCWVWKGALRKGYGAFQPSKDSVLMGAHRYAYQLVKGNIPAGLTLDHLCRNTKCVNPDHLEPATIRENILRSSCITAVNARKTHCPKGHPLIEGNLALSVLKQGKRQCLTCKIQRCRDWRANHPYVLAETERFIASTLPTKRLAA